MVIKTTIIKVLFAEMYVIFYYFCVCVCDKMFVQRSEVKSG